MVPFRNVKYCITISKHINYVKAIQTATFLLLNVSIISHFPKWGNPVTPTHSLNYLQFLVFHF